MTRREIMRAYKVNEYGIITSPGKFEGEMVYVPHLYDVALDGGAEDEEDGGMLIDLTQEDYEEFPELLGYDVAHIHTNDQGFVFCDVSETSK